MRKFEKVKRIEEDIKLPKRATKKSAGYDFFAIEDTVIEPVGHNVFIQPGVFDIGAAVEHKKTKPTKILTGVKVIMEDDECLILGNRSSHPSKKDLVLANGVGFIDADYYNNPDNDGEMAFEYYNVSNEPVVIRKGDKIGQGVFMKYEITDDDDAEGDRTGGFGSTGV